MNTKFEHINTIIFDMDGTLLDTLTDIMDSLNYVLDKYGIKKLSYEEVRTYVGNGAATLIKKAIPLGENNPLFNDILSEYKDYYGKHNLIKTAPYNGVLDVMKELKVRGYKLSIVSNKPDEGVKKLSDYFFPGLTDIAIGESDKINRKPAPDMVEAALKYMCTDKANAVYIGDSEVDLATANNSGLSCISVSWGFRDVDLLKSLGADTIINTPTELLELLK